MRWFRLVRIVEINRGLKKSSLDLYVGQRHFIHIDPQRSKWKTGKTYEPGETFFKQKNCLPINIHENGHEALILNLKLKGENMWDKMRSKREGEFAEVDDKCLVYAHHVLESIAHIFWDCRMVGRAWELFNWHD